MADKLSATVFGMVYFYSTEGRSALPGYGARWIKFQEGEKGKEGSAEVVRCVNYMTVTYDEFADNGKFVGLIEKFLIET